MKRLRGLNLSAGLGVTNLCDRCGFLRIFKTILLCLSLLVPCQPLASEMSTELVSLTLDNGRVIQAELRRPALADGPLPVVMLFGGLRGAATILDTVPRDRAVLSASFDYPFDPPRKLEFPKSVLDLPEMDQGIEDTFEGIALLTRHLRSRADVDADRMTIVGASLGAPFAVISGARLEMPGIVIVHGFGKIREVIAHQFVHRLEPRFGCWVRPVAHALAWSLVRGYDLPAPEAYARELNDRQRALMIVAADDALIPRSATEGLWQALARSGANSERIDEVGGHLRGSEDPRISDLTQTAMAWMTRSGLR